MGRSSLWCLSAVLVALAGCPQAQLLYDFDADGSPDDVDCEPEDPSINPFAVEVCDDQLDNDCDQAIDGDDADCPDLDGDGWANSNDCAPLDATIHPEADDPFGDDVDSNCDGYDGLDSDGDGYPSNSEESEELYWDCNDSNDTVHPGATDTVGDGVDNNCDGVDGVDIDRDGRASEASGGDDCDDIDPDTWPGAAEQVDCEDDDCDGLIDEGTATSDDDGDGWCEGADLGAGVTCCALAAPGDCDDTSAVLNLDDVDGDGASTCDGDCADADPAIGPGAAEVCDGLDDDCDGVVPLAEIDGDLDGSPACDDCDDASAWLDQLDVDGDGVTTCDGDCNDSNAGVYPGALEIPGNGLDDDCVGGEAVDVDGDGAVAGLADCDDADPQVFWGAPEVLDCKDNDCDGAIDEGTATADDDGDGACEGYDFGAGPVCCDGSVPGDCDDGSLASNIADTDGDGVTTCALPPDCDDVNASRLPGGAEVCDGADNDCDGIIPADEVDADGDGFAGCAGDCDDGDPLATPADADGDGYSTCNSPADCDDSDPTVEWDDVDGDGQSTCEGDCDDNLATTWLGAPELCDGLDGACDGASADEADDDGDGFRLCDGDCDDAAPGTWPGAPELCDLVDNDCDGTVDEGTSSDQDGDGFYPCQGDCDDADPTRSPALTEACDGVDNDCDLVVPAVEANDDADGYRICEGDCDDTDDLVNPSAADLCDGADNDCDGVVDGTCLSCTFDVSTDFAALQAAVTAASPGDSICVLPGTYTGNLDLQGKALDLVSRGGLFLTTLDGGSTGSTLTLVGPGAGGLIQGFTITGGFGAMGGGIHVDGASPTLRHLVVSGNGATFDGGGIYLSGGAPDLLDVQVLGNDADYGGGLYAQGASLSLTDVTLEGNEASYNGGGLWLEAGTAVLTNVDVSGNTALVDGGGGWLNAQTFWSGGIVSDNVVRGACGGLSVRVAGSQLDGLQVLDNSIMDTASGGAGGGLCLYADVDVTALVATGNVAKAGGGGLYISGASPTLTDVVISGNESLPWSRGGGVRVSGSAAQPVFDDFAVDDNVSLGGGGIYLHNGADLTATNGSISGNVAPYAGGLYAIHAAAVSLTNVVVIGNVASGSNGGGVSIESNSGYLDLRNVVVAGNQALSGGGGILCNSSGSILNSVVVGNTTTSATSGGGGLILNVPAAGAFSIQNSIISGNAAQGVSGFGGGMTVALLDVTSVLDVTWVDSWGNSPDDYDGIPLPSASAGNVSVDPGFLDVSGADPEDWDLHLGLSSPLIDAGAGAILDPDGLPSDLGAYGGPGAAGWDLDRDGWFEWWSPGPWGSTSSTMDCDDGDPAVYPGSGC